MKENEFQSFTALGKEFQIDGLQSLALEKDSDSKDTNEKIREIEELLSQGGRDIPSKKSKKLKEIPNDLETLKAAIKSKPKLKKIVLNPKSMREEIKQEDEIVSDVFELAINNKIEIITTSEGNRILQCTDCLKQFQKKQKAKFHVEIHLDGFSHTCQLCGASLKTKHTLAMHTYKQHSRNSSFKNKRESLDI